MKTNFVAYSLGVTKADQPEEINSSQIQEEHAPQCQLVPYILAEQV